MLLLFYNLEKPANQNQIKISRDCVGHTKGFLLLFVSVFLNQWGIKGKPQLIVGIPEWAVAPKYKLLSVISHLTAFLIGQAFCFE